MSTTVYEIITAQIIAQLEKGVVPWRQPWRAGLPKNTVSGKVYRGINLFLLSMVNEEFFVTRKQAEEQGSRIRCKGFPVVFWKILERENPKSGEIERIPLLRYYKVYPVSGVDGIEVPARLHKIREMLIEFHGTNTSREVNDIGRISEMLERNGFEIDVIEKDLTKSFRESSIAELDPDLLLIRARNGAFNRL